jgi:hypothetical protein
MATYPKGRRRTLLALVAIGALVLAAASALGVSRMGLERAKDPGLGVRSLHAAGITGEGVHVAIIDGQLNRDHVEYASRMVHYEELDDFTGRPFEMHAPAMVSLLVGRSVGVAPDALLHYFALDFANSTPERLAAAIDHVVARNGGLAPTDHVRLISISTGYRGGEREVVDAALARAMAAGVFVLNTVYPVEHVDPPLAIRGLGCPPWRDCSRPGSFTTTPGEERAWKERGQSVAEVLRQRAESDRAHGHATLYAPASRRTVAGHLGDRAYRFDVEGGDSEWAPYLVGVLALALQAEPDLRANDLAGLLADGVTVRDDGVNLIDPARVVALARER